MCPRAVLVCCAALLLAGMVMAGCGGADDQPIPAAAARALVRDLDSVEQRVRAGECRRARTTLRRLQQTAAGLPENVEPGVRATLDSGVRRLGEMVRVECRQKRPKPKAEPEAPVAPPVDTTPEPTPSYGPPVQAEPEEPVEEEQPQEEQPQEEPNEERPSEEPADDAPPAQESPEPGDSEGNEPDPCPPDAGPTC